MLGVGFEPTISVFEPMEIVHVSDRTASVIGGFFIKLYFNMIHNQILNLKSSNILLLLFESHFNKICVSLHIELDTLLLEVCLLLSWLRNPQRFKVHEGSMPYPQKPFIEPYLEQLFELSSMNK
jgi:uncharacterized membrane protein